MLSPSISSVYKKLQISRYLSVASYLAKVGASSPSIGGLPIVNAHPEELNIEPAIDPYSTGPYNSSFHGNKI